MLDQQHGQLNQWMIKGITVGVENFKFYEKTLVRALEKRKVRASRVHENEEEKQQANFRHLQQVLNTVPISASWIMSFMC